MSIELQIGAEVIPAADPGQPRPRMPLPHWSSIARIDSPWGLYPVEWIALQVALERQDYREFTTDPPYSDAGELAFRRLLDLRAAYADVLEQRPNLDYQSLLLNPSAVYTQQSGQSEDSINGLLSDVEQLQSDLQGHATIGGTSIVTRSLGTLASVCGMAIKLKVDLRMNFVSDPRPVDAPIRYFTASVEGFSRVQHAALRENSIVEIGLASGYLYRVPTQFICEVEGVDRKIIRAVAPPDVPIVLFNLDNGETLGWPWDSVLALCEPAYTEYADLSDHRLRVLRAWSGRRFRVMP